MINLNIQKTYSNAYAKKPSMQSDLGNVNNLKQDTVSFNGWFSKKPPKILVNQEVYQRICSWPDEKNTEWEKYFMKKLRELCEEGITNNTLDDAHIAVREIAPMYQSEVRELLQEAFNNTQDLGLQSVFNIFLKDLGKGPLK